MEHAKWCKIISTKESDFLVEKEWTDTEHLISVYFVMNGLKYVSTSKSENRIAMNEDFDELDEVDCLQIFYDTKAQLN